MRTQGTVSIPSMLSSLVHCKSKETYLQSTKEWLECFSEPEISPSEAGYSMVKERNIV